MQRFLKKSSIFILFLISIQLYASDGRTMSDKLTCYNYEKRIVFILAPDLLIKFDSHNYIMNVIPTRASEALTMDCTTD